jgi:hypothetical protein
MPVALHVLANFVEEWGFSMKDGAIASTSYA